MEPDKQGNMTLINKDCISVMDKMKDSSVNLIVTSPPYNVNLGNNKFKKDGYENYDDNLEYHEYLRWMKRVFRCCMRVLAEDGRLCINIGDGKNGKVPTHSDFIKILTDIGFLPLSTIIWDKQTTSNRAAWGSFMSASAPSIPTQHEYILVFGMSEKRFTKGISTISKEEFVKFTDSIWQMKPETKKIGHPAPFPVELPYRLIQLYSYQDDVVLDPFMGSGTTGVACKKTNRKFIGIEKEKTYFDIAKKRVEDAQKDFTPDSTSCIIKKDISKSEE